jgi:hypothetical protein
MPYITMLGLSFALARIRERIYLATRAHNIKMDEDDPLGEAIDDLQHLANAFYDAIEDNKLNKAMNSTKGNYDD